MFRRTLHKAGILFAGSALVTACGVGGTDVPTDDEIRIGLITSQTGPAASIGIPEREALEYLVKQANDNGGIEGKKVTLVTKDDKTDSTEAATAARELALNDKVQVIIGPTTGSAALAVAPIAAANKVPVVFPGGSIPPTAKDSGFYDWIFRSSITDTDSVPAALEYIKEHGYSRIGLFFQQDAYGEASAKQLKHLADEKSNIQVVSEASAPINASDLSVQATKIAAANPDIIMVQASVAPPAAALIRSLRQAGSTAPIIVSGGMTTQAFLDATGDSSDGVIAVAAVGWDKPTAEQATFIEGFGQPKGFGESIAGTGFMAVQAAIPNVKGDLTGTSIRDALEITCPFPTLLNGPGCFSADDHDGDLSGMTLQVKDSEWVTVG